MTISLTVPANGAHVSGLVTLSWAPVEGATKYRYWVDETNLFFDGDYVPITDPRVVPPFSDTAEDWIEVVEPTVALPNLGVGTFFWKIQQYNGSEWSTDSNFISFTHEALPAPTLLSPINHNAEDGFVTFTWASVTGAVKYLVTWSLAADFGASYSAEVDAPTVMHTPWSRFGVGKWYWKVQASDGVNWSQNV